MVVGLFNDSFPPVMDGVARVFLNYASELKKLGDRSIAITLKIPGMKKEDYDFEVMSFNSYPAPGRREYRWGLGFMDPRFWNKVKDIPFDIVHTHCPFSSHLVARALANKHDIPLITTFHTKYRDDFLAVVKNSALVDNVVIKSIISTYEHTDEVWTVNEASIETLREYGFKGKVVVMENGCDIEPSERTEAVAKRVRERYRLNDMAPIFAYIGQHTHQKNVFMLIDALKLLTDKGIAFHMLFLGDGPQKEEMRDAAEGYGLLDKIHFLGIVRDRELLKDIYLSSYAVLFPSLYDTSSLVPREAAACRCPTVFVKGSSTAQGIEHGAQGFLAGNTPESYASVLQKIVQDPQLRDTVGENARQALYVPWSEAVKKARERYLYIIDKKKYGRRSYEI